MNEKSNIFSLFCKYVDDTIFKDNIGSVVSFIVDQSYIDAFCEKYSIKEVELLKEVSKNMFRRNAPIEHIKGIVAIQVYAATKRANGVLVTSSNYKTPYAELLSWDINDVSWWFREFQDYTWQTLYKWCNLNHYIIAQSAPQSGIPYGYVQYPLQQAERVFTKDELLYIACAFVDNNLYPDDDISFESFWRTINWYSLYRYIHTSHAKNLYSTREYYNDAKWQIFNYFIRWDGGYKRNHKASNVRSESNEDLFVYLKDELNTIDIRNEMLELVHQFQISTFNHNIFTINRKIFPNRRTDLILFKRDDTYENYWQECRFLEGDEEGLAIIFPAFTSRWIQFPKSDLIKSFDGIKIYKVSKNRWSQDLYEEPRKHRLEGGLKIGRRRYILGGAPLFCMDASGVFWIDDDRHTANNEKVSLNHLSEGFHRIRVPGYKDIIIEIINSSHRMSWNENHSQWNIDKRGAIWMPAKVQNGVIGMNMLSICQAKYLQNNEVSTLTAWAMTHHGIANNSKNLIIETLKNISSYE